MNNEITEILQEYLLIEEDSLKHILLDILDLCKSERGASDAIVQLESTLEDYSSGLEFLDRVPLYYIFLSYAQYKWGEFPNSINSASNALQGFKQKNNIRNSVIALWMRALLHQESGHIDAARDDTASGINLAERELEDSKRTSHYKELEDSKIIYSRMLALRQCLNSGFSKSSYAPQPQFSFLSFPIYTLHITPEGKIAYENAPQGEVIVQTLTIKGLPHTIHSLSNWSEVIMRPAAYRWLQIQGDGMDNARPIPILDGDCVLVIDIPRGDYKPHYGEIVIAARHTTDNKEEPALLKRFNREGLCSESKENHPIIALQDVSLYGLVIAVAKQVK